MQYKVGKGSHYSEGQPVNKKLQDYVLRTCCMSSMFFRASFPHSGFVQLRKLVNQTKYYLQRTSVICRCFFAKDMNQNFTKNDIQEARRLDEKCVKNRILEIIVQRMVLDLDFCFALKT